MAGRIHGKNGSMGITTSTGSPTGVTTVADMKSWTLNMATDKVDVTAFGDTNKQQVLGLPAFDGTFSGFWNSATSPWLFDFILGSSPVLMKLVPDTVEPSYYFSGLAYIDGSVNCDSAGAVTVDGTFVAAGNWSATP